MASMKTISLEVSNILGIKAAWLGPNGDHVIIGGDNGQGKSSLVDALMMALCGGKFTPNMPVHKGAEQGSITVVIGNDDRSYEIQLDIDAATNKRRIVVKREDGGKITNPQTILDDLYNMIAFDPLLFTRMKPDAQAQVLRDLVGLDFTALDEQRKEFYDERTVVGRTEKSLFARTQSMPRFEGLPEEEKSISDLIGKLREAEAYNRDADNLSRDVVSASQQIESANGRVTSLEQRIEELEGQLEIAREGLTDAKATVKECQADYDQAVADRDAFVPIDTAPLQTELDEADETNRKIRATSEFNAVAKEHEGAQTEYNELSEKIDQIDEQKQTMLKEAQYPIAGLSVEGNQVTLDDIPFAQLNTAKQLEIAVAMGFAMNTKLKVALIKDGSHLDSKNLELIMAAADRCGGQLIIERVGKGAECSVIIEEGTVIDDRTANPAPRIAPVVRNVAPVAAPVAAGLFGEEK